LPPLSVIYRKLSKKTLNLSTLEIAKGKVLAVGGGLIAENR